jgi:hypothetical protein
VRALLAASLVALVSSGCRETRGALWQLEFADPALRARAVRIAARVRRGTCADAGAAIYDVELGPGEIAPPLPRLGGGVHAFSADARDAACVVYASGCRDVALPMAPGATITTTLRAIPEGPPECVAVPDGGADAP